MTRTPRERASRLDALGGAATAYLLLGIALGFGAPIGFLALRRLLARPRHRTWAGELRRERAAYSYMMIATPIVFGVFGRMLGRQHEKLRATHEHIERLREEFAAIVTHDLRSPLAAILMRLDLLLGQAQDGVITVPAETLRRLRQGGQRLGQMVEDLLDATRIEAARLRLSPEAVDLAAAVSALLERLRPMHGDHAIELVVDGAPPRVQVDPIRLDQIATNLIENAAKYSPEGTPIRIEIRPDRGGATMSVQDRGWGISAAELPHLFDRFYQAKRAREKKTGLGLGLYITKGLVEAHGGRITVRSEVDRGSTFTVWLPAAASDRAARA